MRINYQLIVIFYKPLFALNIGFTLFSAYFIGAHGWHNKNIDINNAVVTTLLKFAGYAASVGYQYTTRKNVYFYYRNAGVSVRKMYAWVLTIDFLIYMFLLCLCNFITK